VLKNLVDRLLRHRADVLAFHSAPAPQAARERYWYCSRPVDPLIGASRVPAAAAGR
jgi:hypothetical protein